MPTVGSSAISLGGPGGDRQDWISWERDAPTVVRRDTILGGGWLGSLLGGWGFEGVRFRKDGRYLGVVNVLKDVMVRYSRYFFRERRLSQVVVNDGTEPALPTGH